MSLRPPGGRGGRRNSWPPTPLARPPNLLLELIDPFSEKEEEEEEEEGDSVLLPRKVSIVPEEARCTIF